MLFLGYPDSGISIHALLAESDALRVVDQGGHAISIHALLAESDRRIQDLGILVIVFLSTLSSRRATQTTVRVVGLVVISIHALLAESDISPRYSTGCWMNFYPRSPRGERRALARGICSIRIFLSTLSSRRAT